MILFKTDYLKGNVPFEAIHDGIGYWHDEYEGIQTLAEFLGLNDNEYKLFVEDESKFKSYLDGTK